MFSNLSSTTSNMFGQPQTPQQSSFGTSQTSAFGQQQTQPTSAFGQPQAQQTSAFGQTQQTSAFGQPQTQQTSAFGQPQTQQTSAFGQTQQMTAFGQPQTQQTSAFGQPQTQQTSAFGQTQQTSAFGQPQTQQTSAFGQPQTQQTSAFGQPQTQQTLGFGQTQPMTAFGQPQTQQLSGFGQSQMQQPQQQQVLSDVAAARIRNIHLAYTSLVDQYGMPSYKSDEGTKALFANDEKCEFDTLIYERKSEVSKAGGTKHKLSKRRQDLADHNNPDSANCVAVRLLGINELIDRYRKQQKDSQSVLTHVESLGIHLSKLREMYAVELTRFQGLKSKQVRLYNKTLSVLRHVEVMRCYKVHFSQKEQIIKDRMLQLNQKLKISQDRLMQLSSLAGQESLGSGYGQSSITTTGNSITTSGGIPVDFSGMNIVSNINNSNVDLDGICNALDKQRIGLSVLTDVLTKNIRDIKIMKRELNLD